VLVSTEDLIVEPVNEEAIPVIVANRDPFFEAPIPASVEVTKTEELTPWSFSLPNAIDLDEDDTVELKVSLGAAVSFLEFNEVDSTFKIADLSSDLVLEGSFSLAVTLDDGSSTVSHTIELAVLPFEPELSEASLEEAE